MFGAETHGTAAPHPQAKLHQRSSLERCSALIFCMNDSSVYVSRSGLVVTKPNKVCFALRTAEALKSVSEEREEKKKKRRREKREKRFTDCQLGGFRRASAHFHVNRESMFGNTSFMK